MVSTVAMSESEGLFVAGEINPVPYKEAVFEFYGVKAGFKTKAHTRIEMLAKLLGEVVPTAVAVA